MTHKGSITLSLHCLFDNIVPSTDTVLFAGLIGARHRVLLLHPRIKVRVMTRPEQFPALTVCHFLSTIQPVSVHLLGHVSDQDMVIWPLTKLTVQFVNGLSRYGMVSGACKPWNLFLIHFDALRLLSTTFKVGYSIVWMDT